MTSGQVSTTQEFSYADCARQDVQDVMLTHRSDASLHLPEVSMRAQAVPCELVLPTVRVLLNQLLDVWASSGDEGEL